MSDMEESKETKEYNWPVIYIVIVVFLVLQIFIYSQITGYFQ